MNKLLLIILIFFLLISIGYSIEYYNKISKKKRMKDLTGIYSHTKTPKGIIFRVQFKDNNNHLDFRIATEKEIKVLKQYKYL